MPLSDGPRAVIRTNLELLQQGNKVRLTFIGPLQKEQLDAINDGRCTRGHVPIVGEVVFIGRHVYESRVVRDGYSIEDVIDQIESVVSADAVVLSTAGMTAMENPASRADRYGNAVRDRVIFECSARYPRPELFSVVPKGDRVKPERLPTE